MDPTAMAPSQSFMTTYKQHLDELEEKKKARGVVEDTPCIPWCFEACISTICCCCRANCCAKTCPCCCTPGTHANHDIAECSGSCCYAWVKALCCMKYTMCERACERACLGCCKDYPFEEWNCKQYMLMGAIQNLGRELPYGNVFAMQWLTKIPYGTGVFRQCGLTVKTVRETDDKGRKVSGEWYEPEGAPDDKVLLYFHGGAFVLQTASAARWYVGAYAKYLGWKTFSADYGHPPQTDYLDMMDGMLATWDYLMSQGIKPENVVIGGDSAGGNLAISLALRLRFSEAHRDQGQIGGLMLISPWVNMYPFSGQSFKENQRYDYIAQRGLIQFVVDLYVEDNNPDNPLFSLYRLSEEELKELPPVYCVVGECEVLEWSIREFFNKTKAARTHSVSDVLYPAPGMPHVPPMFFCAHPFPEVGLVPCLCRCSPCLGPCCCFGHCLVASDPDEAKEHPVWASLEKGRLFLKEVGGQVGDLPTDATGA